MWIALAFVLRVCLRILKPWFHVRFGLLGTRSLGSLAMAPELYLCEKDAGIRPNRGLDVFYYWDQDYIASPHQMFLRALNVMDLKEEICNQQLGIMWKRSIHISKSGLLLDSLNRRLPKGSDDFEVHMPHQDDFNSILGHFPIHLSFTKVEMERGGELLEEMGVPRDAPFVCFHARDNAYLAHTRSSNSEVGIGGDLRNASIQNFMPAIEKLTEMGYWAIRTGKIVNEPLEVGNPKIIDYPTHFQSDFMDIFLSA